MKRVLLSLALVGLVFAPAGAQSRRLGHRIRQTSNSYSTTFPGTENPISQGGRWVNGALSSASTGWANMRMTPGLLFGTQTGASGLYDDSTAILTGTWGNDQTITTTIHIGNQLTGSCFEELEHRHRMSLSYGQQTGYEVNWSVKSDDGYIGIWGYKGPSCSVAGGTSACFFQLGVNCTGVVLHDGDILKSTSVGNVLTAYVNSVQQCQRTDGSSTYTSGNPGLGAWINNNAGACSSFAATDYGFKDLQVSAQ